MRLKVYTRTVFKDSFVPSVNIDLLMKEILHLIYSKYMKELSMSVANVNIELLQRLILYVIYSKYIKEMSMTVNKVNI